MTFGISFGGPVVVPNGEIPFEWSYSAAHTTGTSGIYTWVQITASGDFVITSGERDIEHEIIAPGGGGGIRSTGDPNGPGGAGKRKRGNAVRIVGTFPAVIGLAGIGAPVDQGGDGGDSSIFGVTAKGGGGGGGAIVGAAPVRNGRTGGHGGGAGVETSLSGTGGATNDGGNSGGNSFGHATSANRAAGGGGGEGGAGANGADTNGGDFGAGVTSDCPGFSDVICQGGAGLTGSGAGTANGGGFGCGANGSSGGSGAGQAGKTSVIRLWWITQP
jgi:hypothetical protein